MTHLVVDASVVLRHLIGRSAEAEGVMLREGLAAPGTLIPETLNGLVTSVRTDALEIERAIGLFEEFKELPIEIVDTGSIGSETIRAAEALGLSAYDASYVALAEHLGAPLVTADRSLARRHEGAELIP